MKMLKICLGRTRKTLWVIIGSFKNRDFVGYELSFNKCFPFVLVNKYVLLYRQNGSNDDLI